jgi:indole-3-glycerol phosphate synthase
MATILEKITTMRLERLSEEKRARSLQSLAEQASAQEPPLDFTAAFQGPGIHIIAEVKKASPSKGILKQDLNTSTLARSYEEGGAAAISVLTEEDHFQGSLAALIQVRSASSMPILRKDFILDEYQIVEARAAGADSFLLIAAIMNAKLLESLISAGRHWNMEPLVEVHDMLEMDMALSVGARIIGVNNRNLKTFLVDLNTTLDLVKRIPNDCVCVSESGIRTRDDILSLADAGVKGFLIGESLVTAKDPAEKLREFIHGR